MRTSHGVTILDQWAEGNVTSTSYGSTREIQYITTEQKIQENKIAEAQKEVINIL